MYGVEVCCVEVCCGLDSRCWCLSFGVVAIVVVVAAISGAAIRKPIFVSPFLYVNGRPFVGSDGCWYDCRLRLGIL